MLGMTELVALPVIFKLFAGVAHAGLVGDDLVRPRADAGFRIVLAAIGLYDEMIVRHQIREVGIRVLQRDDDIVAIDLDGVDALHDAECRRFRFRIAVAFERCHHVFGLDGLAVVEFDILPDFHRPGLGVVGGTDFLGKPVFDAAVRLQFEQQFAPALAEIEGNLAQECRRIEAVGRFTASQTCGKLSTLDGLLRPAGGCQKRVCKRSCNAKGRRAAEKIAAVHLACRDALAQEFEFFRHGIAPIIGLRLSAFVSGGPLFSIPDRIIHELCSNGKPDKSGEIVR